MIPKSTFSQKFGVSGGTITVNPVARTSAPPLAHHTGISPGKEGVLAHEPSDQMLCSPSRLIIRPNLIKHKIALSI